MKSQHGHRWTDEELKTLIAMWFGGKEFDEMAAVLGTTRFALNKQICRMRKEGIPLPRRTQGHKAGRRNTPWTQEEVEYLVRRREQKATAEDIATELDRTFFGVQGMIAKLRTEDVPVPMLGNGIRKLWCPEKLKIACAGRGLARGH